MRILDEDDKKILEQDMGVGLNRFNPETVTLDKTIRESGGLVTSSGNFTSDFIPCNGGDTFYFGRKVGSAFYHEPSATVSHFAQYDASKQFISGTRVQWVNKVTLEKNCAYVRFSNPSSQLSTSDTIIYVTFNTDLTADTVEPFSTFYVNEYRVKQIESVKASLENDVGNLSAEGGDLESGLRNANLQGFGDKELLTANLLDPSLILPEKVISATGVISYASDTMISGFIPVVKDDIVYFSFVNNGTLISHSATKFRYVVEYDQNMRFLSRSSAFVNDYVVQGNTAGYIRAVVTNRTMTDTVYYEITKNEYPSTLAECAIFKSTAKDTVAREAIQTEKQKFDSAIPYVDPENWFDPSNVIEGKVISSTGEIINSTGGFVTNHLIPVLPGDIVTLSRLKTDGTFMHAGINFVYIAMYDADEKFISRSSAYVQDFEISESDCRFIRVVLNNAYIGDDTEIAEISINCIPTKASITSYVAPHFDAKGYSNETLRSRKVLWLGTSIPTYGYPQILARMCGCTMHNNAIGSSGIMEGITPKVTTANICGVRSIWGLYGLTQTISQKKSMIENWSTIAAEIGDSTELTQNIINIAMRSSYETILDPYLTGGNAVDLIVLNHAYNDSVEYALLPDDAPDIYDCHYLEGAYNWVIKRIYEAKPTMGIVIFGHYSDLPEQKETALSRVAERWNIPYYLLKNDLGWSTQEINTTKKINSDGEWETITSTNMMIRQMWLGDGIHPLGVASTRIAEVSQNQFMDWLKMYCD